MRILFALVALMWCVGSFVPDHQGGWGLTVILWACLLIIAKVALRKLGCP